MTKEEHQTLRGWFEHYTDRFRDPNGGLHPLLELKRCHSLRVADNACCIAKALKFSSSERLLAETAGLLHDVGRFTQFVRYGSYRDADTVDHGAEGQRVLLAQNRAFLPDPAEWELLLCVVECHNRRRADIPPGLDPEKSRFLRLVRDADKLDIMELVLRAVAIDGFDDLQTMLPHLRPGRELSPEVLAEAVKTGSVSSGHLATLGDFLVMMATWCCDMNHQTTRRFAVQRGLLPRIRRELPDARPVSDLFAHIADALKKGSPDEERQQGKEKEG